MHLNFADVYAHQLTSAAPDLRETKRHKVNIPRPLLNFADASKTRRASIYDGEFTLA